MSLDPFVIRDEVNSKHIDVNKYRRETEEIARSAEKFHEWEPYRLLENAMKVAAFLKVTGLKTNQVRRVLEMARDIELKIRVGRAENITLDVTRMRFLLAYTVGRAGRRERSSIEAFYRVLDPMLKQMSEDEDFARRYFGKFFDFLQAVVAYHRFFGGEEK